MYGTTQTRTGSTHVRHYYGDWVRFLFVVVATISLIAIPVLGNLLNVGLFGQIGGTILLVVLAGITNPHSKVVMVCNTFVAGFGVLLFEAAAIAQSPFVLDPLLFVRQINALLMLIALYYAIKSVRAMFLGTIGKEGRAGEFR